MFRLRSAFTLVELLVVIAIIGVLVGILLPAVQAARESARRTQCTNQIRQIGLALHNYMGVHKFLPFGKGPSYPGAPVYARWSQHALMLPFLEQSALWEKCDFSYPPETPGMAGVLAFMPPYTNANGKNAIASRTAVPGFLCPSDAASSDPWQAQNNYVANQGSWLCDRTDAPALPTDTLPNEIQTGIFYLKSKVSSAHIRDGLSHTAFFSEKIRGHGIPDARSDMFVIPHQVTQQGVFDACNAINPLTATPLTSKWGYSWVMGENCCTQYNHVAVPNSKTCGGTGFPGTMTNMAMQVAPSSHHTGGVQVLFGDGAVTVVTSDIDLVLWRAIGTRAGLENSEL